MKNTVAYQALFILLSIFLSSQSKAQEDSIIVYEFKTGLIEAIPPVQFDTRKAFDNTEHSFGEMNQVPLELITPTSNVFSGSSFSKIMKADTLFNDNDFPISTGASLILYEDGKLLKESCSGTLVSGNFVLTSAACIKSYFSPEWYADSIIVGAGFGDSNDEPFLTKTHVTKCYLTESYYKEGNLKENFALLELADPIGLNNGWVGLAFIADTNYYNGKVFHKLSYPNYTSPQFPSNNGDTLYYNYGEIDVEDISTVIVDSPEANQIPGQGGSALFYTDNTDYYAFATTAYSHRYHHFTLSNHVFYQFKNVLEKHPVGVVEIYQEHKVRVYPNPANGHVLIELEKQEPSTVRIFNVSGRTLIHEPLQSGASIDVSSLDPGTYILQVENSSSGSVVVEQLIIY